ncbi:MAG: hypothetical protein ONB13_10430, partial [candidate division KSB1 bacterium]|nr:hypothetical protein [candidate division KSB1 bacterium]
MNDDQLHFDHLSIETADKKIRLLLDQGLQSDQFWWATKESAFWQPKMVKRGAELLLKAIILNPKASEKEK